MPVIPSAAVVIPSAARNLYLALAALLLATPASAQRDSAEAAKAFEQGRVAHRARRTGEAVEQFERAVKLDANNASYHMWLGHGYSRHLANVNFIKKASIGRAAGKAYARAVELDPRSIEAAESYMGFLMEAPGIAGGGMDKARAEAARIATLSAMRGRMAEGRIAEHEKEPGKAEVAYRAAMALEPDSTYPVDALTFLLQNAGRYQDAFKIVDDRLARFPNEPGTLYALGRVASLSGERLSVGESALRRFLALVGVDSLPRANAHYRIGLIREKAGDVASARSEYRTAMELVPGHELSAKALERLDKR